MSVSALLVVAIALSFIGLAVLLACFGVLALALARWCWHRHKNKNPFQP